MTGRKPNRKKIVLGVTGSFGSGKTTVARIFRSYGSRIIDADRIAHCCITPGTKTYKRICKLFGKNILKKNRTIDRVKLARIVFDNKDLLRELNKIIHPEVIRIVRNKIKKSLPTGRQEKSKIIVLDAPLLLEAGLRRIVDKLIVVKIKGSRQLERIQRRFSLSREDIRKRIKQQMPLQLKVRLADFVIDNSGTIGKTKKQVKEVWKKVNLTLDIKDVKGSIRPDVSSGLIEGGCCGKIRHWKFKRNEDYRIKQISQRIKREWIQRS